jgi:chemotaxis response regulator CheB
VKLGIVNDVPAAADALRRAIAMEPQHEVIWVARDGAEAVAYCANRTPDVVLMEMGMPVMNGVEATRQIMARTPCAILIVTASVGANAAVVFEAMGHGALDAIDTPAFGATDPRKSAAPLLSKIESIGKLINCEKGRLDATARRTGIMPAIRQDRLVAIGSSAGGPGALAKVLSGLPANFSAAIVIVQHVDALFAGGMAEWLNQHSQLPVRVAQEGDHLESGCVFLAGTSHHLTLTSGSRLAYTSEPSDYAYRPSVDVFFRSVCRHWQHEAVGVLLTGMGRDGALGLKALRDKGCHTIAQDQASSAVYGMPKAAVTLNAAVDVLPLERIATRLISIFDR